MILAFILSGSSAVDGGGVYGHVFHYSMIFFLMGSAFLAFLHFWRRGELDMSEEPKYQMMESDNLYVGEKKLESEQKKEGI